MLAVQAQTLSVAGKCLTEVDNKIKVSECNNQDDSQKWEYTAFPLFRYKNKKTNRCLLSTGSALETGMCRGNDTAQHFKNSTLFRNQEMYEDAYGTD